MLNAETDRGQMLALHDLCRNLQVKEKNTDK